MDANKPTFGEKLVAAVANGNQADVPAFLDGEAGIGPTSLIDVVSTGGQGEELRCELREDLNGTEWLFLGRGSRKSGYVWDEIIGYGDESTKRKVGELSRFHSSVYRRFFGDRG